MTTATNTAEMRRAKSRRDTKNNGPVPYSDDEAARAASNLKEAPGALAILNHYVGQYESELAEGEARNLKSIRLYEQWQQDARAVAHYNNVLQNHTEPHNRTKQAYATLEGLKQKAARSKARHDDHMKRKTGGRPEFAGSRAVAFLSKLKRPQIEIAPLIPKAFQKYEGDPAAGITAVRERLAKIDSDITGVFNAFSPAREGSENFMRVFDSKRRFYSWDSLLRVREDSKGHVVESNPEMPDTIIADALREHVHLYVDKRLEEAVRKAKEAGHAVLSRGERTKRLKKLRAEYAELEDVEGYWLRQLFLAGETPWVRPDMDVRALCGVIPDPATEFEEASRAVIHDVPAGVSASQFARAVSSRAHD